MKLLNGEGKVLLHTFKFIFWTSQAKKLETAGLSWNHMFLKVTFKSEK